MTNRQKLGSGLWLASAVLFPAQIIAAAAWPTAYSLSNNTISDLGVTRCATYSESGGAHVRDVCSPSHWAFNSGMIVSGFLIAIGSVLLWNVFARRRPGNAALLASVLGGLAIAGIGVLPWNEAPDDHDFAALLQALLQWLAMICVALAVWGAGARARLASLATVAALAISVAGFALFVDLQSGHDGVLSFGIAERMSFDTLALWTAGAGLALLVNQRSAEGSESAEAV